MKINSAYQIASAKAENFKTDIIFGMAAKAEAPFLITLTENIDTLVKILKEGSVIGDKVNEGEFKTRMMGSVMGITMGIFLAETLKYITMQQKQKFLEQLRIFTVPVAVPNIN